jgi:hypothetical protein
MSMKRAGYGDAKRSVEASNRRAIVCVPGDELQAQKQSVKICFDGPMFYA